MKVIIDTPELLKSLYLRGTKWHILSKWDYSSNGSVIVPRAVIDDASAVFSGRIREAARIANLGLRNVAALLPDRETLTLPPVKIEEEVAHFRDRLVGRIKGLGFQIEEFAGVVPVTSGSAKDEIVRQLAQKYLLQSGSSVTIITPNTFPAQERVTICRSVTEFARQHAKPVAKFERTIKLIEDDRHPKFNLSDFVRGIKDELVAAFEEYLESWGGFEGHFTTSKIGRPRLAHLGDEINERTNIDGWFGDGGTIGFSAMIWLDGMVECRLNDTPNETVSGRVTFNIDLGVELDAETLQPIYHDMGSTLGHRLWKEDWQPYLD